MKVIFLSLFILLNLDLFSQSNWGFAAASIQVSTGDTLSNYFLVSKVKNLSRLSKLRTTGTDANPRKSVYSVSLGDWFYSSLRNSRFETSEGIHREDVLTEIHLHSDLGERYMVTPPEEKNPIFMSRKMASKKRRQFIELARTNGDRIIVIN